MSSLALTPRLQNIDVLEEEIEAVLTSQPPTHWVERTQRGPHLYRDRYTD